MTISEIKAKIQSPEYDFLRTNPHLGDNIMLLGLGGSYAYGTNIDTSDLDVRGFAINSKAEILAGENFEQVEDKPTDTLILSLYKIISLLASCNPNTIEIIGLKEDHYLKVTPIGKMLIENGDMFLSRKAIHSFGGFSFSQLRRIDNKAVRKVDQKEKEQHILNSIHRVIDSFNETIPPYPDNALNLYIDKSEQDDLDSEIFMDINLSHYPVRDYCNLFNNMQNVVREYSKVVSSKADSPLKIAKHQMHLIRLYYMCIDILEKQKVITYRDQEHDLLMDIRNGKYLDSNSQPIPEFYEMVDEVRTRLEYAKNNTSLPEKPDWKRIKEFVMYVNEKVVKGEV